MRWRSESKIKDRSTTWYITDGKVNNWTTNYNYLPDIKIDTTGTSVEINGLVAGESAYCYVTSYDEDDFFNDFDSIDLSTLPGQMKVPYVHMAVYSSSLDYYTRKPTKVNSYTLRCYVQQQSLADGYQIRVLNSKGKKVTDRIVGSSTLSTGFYGLTGTQYFVKMRAFRTINGKKVYGGWSPLTSALVQPTCQARRNGKNIEIRWNKIDGATEYDIYMIGKTKGTFTKVKTVKKGKTSAIIKKLKGNRFKSGKSYYYFVIAKRKLKSGSYD